jgi:dimethylaniline monooxygenase (N-oxide forming)
LCAIKHCLDAGLNVIAFEQTNSIGGTWVYVEETGCDQNGLDIFTSCYQGLTTNLPKEIMGFPHFRFDDSSVQNRRSYIGAQEVLQFFHDYAAKFGLLAHIRMEHQVIRICPKSSGNKKWEVVVCNVAKKEYSIHFFDGVLVCAGHYSKPFIPDYPGRDDFEGEQTHSHYFRKPDKFAGEDILIIGAGPSAHDIALETATVARRVTVSHHREKLMLPADKILQKTDVKEFTKTGVRFVDGSNETYTTIIHCTGYLYSYPFLSSDCGIHVTDNFVQPLWKQCINIRHPTMAIIGIPFNICPSHLSDLQVRKEVNFT